MRFALLAWLFFPVLLQAAPPGAKSGSEIPRATPYQPFHLEGEPVPPVQLAAFVPPTADFQTPPPESRRALPATPRLPAATENSESGGPTVPGRRAVLRGAVAYAPEEAPLAIKRLIWAVNGITRRPYKWGGGHASFTDNGYDCSGTISFALHHAGQLGTPMSSQELSGYGASGAGRWLTVYAAPGRHAFAVVAGLRLDTTDFNRGGDVGPRWHADFRSTSGYRARHASGL